MTRYGVPDQDPGQGRPAKLLAAALCCLVVLLRIHATKAVCCPSARSNEENQGQELRRLDAHSSWVSQVSFSSDGRYIVSASRDESLGLWKTVSGEPVWQYRGFRRFPSSAVFSKNGEFILSLDLNGDLFFHDAASGKRIRRVKAYSSHADLLAILSDGRRAVTSGGGDSGPKDVVCKVKLWDLSKAKVLRTFDGHASFVSSLAVSPDGRSLLTGAGSINGRLITVGGSVILEWTPLDCTVRLWDVDTGKEVRRFEGHMDTVKSVAFSPDGRLAASGSLDETVRIWEIKTGKEIHRLRPMNQHVWCVAFAPDGKYVVSGGREEQLQGQRTTFPVRLWEATTGKEVHRFTGHTDTVTTLTFSPDGSLLLTGSFDGTVRLWRLPR